MATNNSWNSEDPVQVAKGGTGVATLSTAYGVLCAGTTATSDVQTLGALGAAGTVLTSNGAAALPTFQASGAGSTPTKIGVGYDNNGLPGSDYHILQAAAGNAIGSCGVGGEDYFTAIPFYIRDDVTVTNVGMYCTTDTLNQRSRFAIFTDDDGDFGTRVCESGEIDNTASAFSWYTAGIAFTKGPAWLVITAKENSSLGFRALIDTLCSTHYGDGTTLYGAVRWTGTYGEISAALTFSGLSLSATDQDCPVIYLQIA